MFCEPYGFFTIAFRLAHYNFPAMSHGQALEIREYWKVGNIFRTYFVGRQRIVWASCSNR